MVDIEYSNACTEVLEILKYISKEDYNKIPKKKIQVLEMDKNEDYIFKYDINKTLEEQNVSEKAETIIAIFFRDYWATEKQRIAILNSEKAYKAQRERELMEKYNPDNLFKKNQLQDEIIEPINNDEMQMIEYKEETIISKVINKIKSYFAKLFRKNNK